MLKTPSPLQSRGSPPTGALQPPAGAGNGSSPAFRWNFLRRSFTAPVSFHLKPESWTASSTSDRPVGVRARREDEARQRVDDDRDRRRAGEAAHRIDVVLRRRVGNEAEFGGTARTSDSRTDHRFLLSARGRDGMRTPSNGDAPEDRGP